MQEKVAQLIEKELEGLNVKSEDKKIDDYIAAWENDRKAAAEKSAAEENAQVAPDAEAKDTEKAEGESKAE